jgi:hypothetical protein
MIRLLVIIFSCFSFAAALFSNTSSSSTAAFPNSTYSNSTILGPDSSSAANGILTIFVILSLAVIVFLIYRRLYNTDIHIGSGHADIVDHAKEAEQTQKILEENNREADDADQEQISLNTMQRAAAHER